MPSSSSPFLSIYGEELVEFLYDPDEPDMVSTEIGAGLGKHMAAVRQPPSLEVQVTPSRPLPYVRPATEDAVVLKATSPLPPRHETCISASAEDTVRLNRGSASLPGPDPAADRKSASTQQHSEALDDVAPGSSARPITGVTLVEDDGLEEAGCMDFEGVTLEGTGCDASLEKTRILRQSVAGETREIRQPGSGLEFPCRPAGPRTPGDTTVTSSPASRWQVRGGLRPPALHHSPQPGTPLHPSMRHPHNQLAQWPSAVLLVLLGFLLGVLLPYLR